MTEKYTFLEEIIKNTTEYHKELYEFLGFTFNYEAVDNSQTNGNALDNVKWLENKVKSINSNLKKESISISIVKSLNEFSNHIDNSKYLPNVRINHPVFKIDFISTNFFNKIIIYNEQEDLLQITPILKSYNELSENDSDIINSILQTVTSELTQYTYFNTIPKQD